MDLSSHNTNPPGVFDGESLPLSDLADANVEEGIDAIRRFFAEERCLPTEESWTAAQMVPSERTIRRRFGSFRSAGAAAGIALPTGAWDSHEVWSFGTSIRFSGLRLS